MCVNVGLEWKRLPTLDLPGMIGRIILKAGSWRQLDNLTQSNLKLGHGNVSIMYWHHDLGHRLRFWIIGILWYDTSVTFFGFEESITVRKCTCFSFCLDQSGHNIHITNDWLPNVGFCKQFMKASIIIPTMSAQYWYWRIWSKIWDYLIVSILPNPTPNHYFYLLILKAFEFNLVQLSC